MSGRGLRVGHFYRDFGAEGGIPRETALLVDFLRPFCAHQCVYTYVSPMVEKREGVSVYGYAAGRRAGWDPSYIPTELDARLRDNRDELDILILTSSFLPANRRVAAAARRGGIPYVVSIGAGFDPSLVQGAKGVAKRAYYRLFEKHLLDSAVALRLYSTAQVDHLRRFGRDESDRLIIAKEGIDWHEIAVVPPRDLVDLAVPPVFGYMGRLDVWGKGLDVLLEAWSMFEQRGGEGRLEIVGPGAPQEVRRLEQIMRSRRTRRVVLRPPVSGAERFEVMSGWTALVCPSRHEGVPRVVREALATGVPVLVSEATNLADIVTATGSGLVVGDSADSLCRALMSVVSGRPQWGVRPHPGAVQAQGVLSWPRIASEYYSDLVGIVARSERQ